MRRFTKRRLWYYTGYPLSAQEKLAISPKKKRGNSDKIAALF